MLCFIRVQGVLNQMHDQISRLQEELRRKEKMIEELRTSLAELSGKMEKIETTSSVSAHRIGTYMFYGQATASMSLVDCYVCTM